MPVFDERQHIEEIVRRVKEYGALVARSPSDSAAHNNRALCLTRLREMPQALDEMREVVGILPNRALYRVNLALYAAYASDFTTAQTEAARAQQMSPLGNLPLAFAQLGLGRLDDARRTWEALGKASPVGASFAASGLGDLAIFSGRYADGIRILEEGAAADRAAGNPDRAAAKLAAVAFAELSRGRKAAAIAAAGRAIGESETMKVRFLAGRIYALHDAAVDPGLRLDRGTRHRHRRRARSRGDRREGVRHPRGDGNEDRHADHPGRPADHSRRRRGLGVHRLTQPQSA
jgi:tetratricopeptide (TPR) repeat protein